MGGAIRPYHSSRLNGLIQAVALTGQLSLFRSGVSWAFAAMHTAQRVCSPKVPGEPMRVQPSRARKVTSDDV